MAKNRIYIFERGEAYHCQNTPRSQGIDNKNFIKRKDGVAGK